MLVYAPKAPLASGTRRLLATSSSLPLDAGLLLAGLVASVDGARALQGRLRGCPRVSAWPHDGGTPRDEQALRAEGVEQLPVVRDEKADPIEARQRIGYGAAGRRIDVVGGLVHGKDVRSGPQGAGHL